MAHALEAGEAARGAQKIIATRAQASEQAGIEPFTTPAEVFYISLSTINKALERMDEHMFDTAEQTMTKALKTATQTATRHLSAVRSDPRHSTYSHLFFDKTRKITKLSRQQWCRSQVQAILLQKSLRPS